VAAAAEAFVRRTIADLLATLPRPRAHTPPSTATEPPPGGTAARRRPYRPTTWVARDRKSFEETSEGDEEPDKDDRDEQIQELPSALALKHRDSLIMSQMRLSRSHVSSLRPTCTPLNTFCSLAYCVCSLMHYCSFVIEPRLFIDRLHREQVC